MGRLSNNFVVKATDKVHGSTMIDHKIRNDLGLSMEEYCIMELLYRRNNEEKDFSYDTIYRYTGINMKQAEAIVIKLSEEKLILRPKGSKKLKSCQQWTSMHNKQTNTEFSTFWRKEGRIMWTGSKAAALRLYLKLRQKHTAIQLLKNKKAYFEFLNLAENSFRQVMACERFLNPKDENFLQPWKEQTETIINKRNCKDKPPISGQNTIFSTETRKQHNQRY